MSLLHCENFTDLLSSSFHGENGLRSPCKGTVLPKSASSAISPVVCQSLRSLPSSLPNSTIAPSSARRQLVSPQITKWFRKSTPRKLAVTPKKSSSTRDTKSNIVGVKRKLCSELDSDDSLGVTQLGGKCKVQRSSSRENDPKLLPSKPPRTESSNTANVLAPVESNCSKHLAPVLEAKPLSDVSDVNVSNAAQSSITSTSDVVGTSLRSPTVNLPNYVYDPQPRAPVGRRMSPVKRRQSCDWLTQLRLQWQNNNEQADLSTRSPAGVGQVRRSTTKASNSSALKSRSSTSSSKASPLNTEVVGCF